MNFNGGVSFAFMRMLVVWRTWCFVLISMLVLSWGITLMFRSEFSSAQELERQVLYYMGRLEEVDAKFEHFVNETLAREDRKMSLLQGIHDDLEAIPEVKAHRQALRNSRDGLEGGLGG